jgi:dipeptidyl aminopeptidase/acylaminoacyl peptidase
VSDRAVKAGILLILLGGVGAAAERKAMTPRDIIALKQVLDPQISPDGQLVVFVVTELVPKENLYQSDLWRVGATSGEPHRLTHHPKNDRAPAWSPDGQFLAFLSEREEKAQVFLMSARGGEPWRLTEAKEGVTAFTWAPDSAAIAYLTADSPSEEEEKKTKAKDDERVIDQDFKWAHLFKVTLADRKAVRLTEGSFTLSNPQWSPDGTEIAVVRHPTPKADDGRLSDILIVPVAGGPPRELYSNQGPDMAPRWSPDGKHIAFLSRDGNLPSPGTSSLYVIAAAGGAAKRLTEPDLNPGAPQWSKDGKTLWFTAGKGLRGVVASAPVAGGRTTIEIEGPFVVGSLSLARETGTLAYLRQDPQNPSEVWVESPVAEKNPPLQRTRMNPQVSELLLGQAQPWRWKSADGREMEGVLYLPSDHAPGKRLPLLVEAHGGPSGVYTLSFPGSWGSYAHCYTGRGWAVFQPNFRGSSNYGDAFLRANVRDWGGGDFQDIMSGVDDLVARGVADPERMAFHGWSYGGYLTAWTITQTARFKAAACGAGLTNMFSMYSTNDLQRTLEDYFGAEPWDDNEAYHRASALYHIKKAVTPTLILHGEKDERVPLGQAQELYMGLRKNGVPVEMVVYPREPHGLREPNHQLDKMERELAWFDKWVLEAEGRGPTSGGPEAR